MGNFELLFISRMPDGSLLSLTRIIAAPNRIWARLIGVAMEGELITQERHLDYCEQVIPAYEPGHRAAELTLGAPRQLSDNAIWDRVLSMLNIRPSEVKWFFTWQGKKIGFGFK